MKRALTLIAAFLAFTASAQDTKTKVKTKTSGNNVSQTSMKEGKTMSAEQSQKAWMDYMTPGEAHKMMASEEGTWKTETTMWTDPSAPPQKSDGTAEIRMIMDGRYQTANFKGNMMGMPFEGISTVAYDNAKKVYVSSWIDNMGTGLMTMEGKMMPDGKTLVTRGKMVDPMTGKDMMCREVYKIVDEKTRMMEMYCTQDGKETKMMEMKMMRQ